MLRNIAQEDRFSTNVDILAQMDREIAKENACFGVIFDSQRCARHKLFPLEYH